MISAFNLLTRVIFEQQILQNVMTQISYQLLGRLYREIKTVVLFF